MKIQNSVSIKPKVNFKKGLSDLEKKWVREYGDKGYQHTMYALKNFYGIDAEFNGSLTAAYSAHRTIRLFESLGFELPKKIKFEPLPEGTLGTYTPSTDTVRINSAYEEFHDIKKQNRLEESQIGYHPNTGHFLQTYLHEFSHAAHYKNLCKKLGETKAYDLFFGFLSKSTPKDFIVGPINTVVKRICPDFASKVINEVFPPENGLYSKTDLTEYFAECNARKVAKLADCAGYHHDFAKSYKEHPYDYDFASELIKKAAQCCPLDRNIFLRWIERNIASIYVLVKQCKEEIAYTNGDIWEGNINYLKDCYHVNANW